MSRKIFAKLNFNIDSSLEKEYNSILTEYNYDTMLFLKKRPRVDWRYQLQ